MDVKTIYHCGCEITQNDGVIDYVVRVRVCPRHALRFGLPDDRALSLDELFSPRFKQLQGAIYEEIVSL